MSTSGKFDTDREWWFFAWTGLSIGVLSIVASFLAGLWGQGIAFSVGTLWVVAMMLTEYRRIRACRKRGNDGDK